MSEPEITFQLIERGPALLRVELHLVGAGRGRSAILDSIGEQVVVNLDVAIPAGRDSLEDLDVALLIGVDRELLLLRDDHPSLRKVRADDSTNQESSERLLQPSLALRGPVSDKAFDAGHEVTMRRVYLKSSRR